MKTPALKMKTIIKGEYTGTLISLVYVEGITDPALVREVETRLAGLKLKDVLESKYIEEGIIDQRYSPFPQMLATERPDVVASNLMEGRFGLVIDGTPCCLVAPVNFFTMLQSPEDYYENIYMSLFVRWLRYIFYAKSLLLPSDLFHGGYERILLVSYRRSYRQLCLSQSSHATTPQVRGLSLYKDGRYVKTVKEQLSVGVLLLSNELNNESGSGYWARSSECGDHHLREA